MYEKDLGKSKPKIAKINSQRTDKKYPTSVISACFYQTLQVITWSKKRYQQLHNRIGLNIVVVTDGGSSTLGVEKRRKKKAFFPCFQGEKIGTKRFIPLSVPENPPASAILLEKCTLYSKVRCNRFQKNNRYFHIFDRQLAKTQKKASKLDVAIVEISTDIDLRNLKYSIFYMRNIAIALVKVFFL